MTNQRLSVRDLCFAGIFTAIIAVLAQISIPMPYSVPMTLQTFVIPLAGVVLGAKRGALSALLYVLLGAAGVPVFAGFMGGVGVLFGATGGFILSFPLMALTAGIGTDKNNRALLAAGLAAGSILNSLCGMLLFSAVTSSGLQFAFTACVLPFLPTAVIKAVLAGVLGMKIRGALEKGRLIA